MRSWRKTSSRQLMLNILARNSTRPRHHHHRPRTMIAYGQVNIHRCHRLIKRRCQPWPRRTTIVFPTLSHHRHSSLTGVRPTAKMWSAKSIRSNSNSAAPIVALRPGQRQTSAFGTKQQRDETSEEEVSDPYVVTGDNSYQGLTSIITEAGQRRGSDWRQKLKEVYAPTSDDDRFDQVTSTLAFLPFPNH